MTITIDETTGLPELPEGQFWRVGPTRHDNLAMLQLMEKTLVTTTTKRRRVVTEVVSDGEKELVSRYIQEFYKENGLTEWKEEDTPPSAIPENFKKGGGRQGRPIHYRDTSVTKESILRTAIKIMEKIAEENERATLYGDYPPKSLTN